MKGEILIIKKQITCNVVGCEGIAKFKWFFRHDENHKLNRIGNSSNIIQWLGWGEYICEVTCENVVLQVSNKFLVSTPAILPTIIAKSPEPKLTSYWSLDKIPESEEINIINLISNNDVTQLIKIHHRYQVSSNGYCCGSDTSEVIPNFQKYLDGLRAKRQKMVEGSN